MQRWFDTPLGMSLLEAQRSLCRDLSVPPGFQLVHLGVSPLHGVDDCFSLSCQFTFVQEPGSGADGISRFEALPLPSDTFDLVVLHHALDFCHQPQRVLAEAARIIRPGGRVVLVGFNPYSLLGIGKWLLAPWHAAGVWRHNSLRRSRVCDWLVLLGFWLDPEPEINTHGVTSRHRSTRTPRKIFERFLVGGWNGFYVLTACKRTIPLQPHSSFPWLPLRITGIGVALNRGNATETSREGAH